MKKSRGERWRCTHSEVDGHGVDLWDLQAGSVRRQQKCEWGRRQEADGKQTGGRGGRLVLTCSSVFGSTEVWRSEEAETQKSGKLVFPLRLCVPEGVLGYLLGELAPAPGADLSISRAQQVAVSGQKGKDRPLMSCRTTRPKRNLWGQCVQNQHGHNKRPLKSQWNHNSPQSCNKNHNKMSLKNIDSQTHLELHLVV